MLWFTRLNQALTQLWFLTRMYNYIGVATESRQMVFSPSSRPTRFTTARTTPPAFSDASIVIEWTSNILSEYPTFISGLKKRCHIFKKGSPFIVVKLTLVFVLLVLNLKFLMLYDIAYLKCDFLSKTLHKFWNVQYIHWMHISCNAERDVTYCMDVASHNFYQAHPCKLSLKLQKKS